MRHGRRDLFAACSSRRPYMQLRAVWANDEDLKDDFGDDKIINRPKGKVYKDREDGKFIEKVHGRLLRDNVCPK